MMKTRRKLWCRVLSTVLALMMIFPAFPFDAFAADGGAEGTEIGSGKSGLRSTAFAAPAVSITASAWQMQVSGTGSTSIVQVSDAAWNSTSNTGVRFFYTLTDAGGSVYSNNLFNGQTGIPSGCGTVSYSFVYYATDPAAGGKTLYNTVPVGMTQSAWMTALSNYDNDPGNYVNGMPDYTNLLKNTLTWFDASQSSNTVLPLAYSMGGDGSIVYEPHYYSVFVKWEADGSAPVISTDNSVVYVHAPGEGGAGAGTGAGGGTGTGGEGGGGVIGGDGGGGTGAGGEGGSGTSSLVAPVDNIYAVPCTIRNGYPVAVNDVEVSDRSATGVYFYYSLEDSAGGKFSDLPTDPDLGAGDGEVQYVFVYSDAKPGVRTMTSMTPVGMIPSDWQATVAAYEAAHPALSGGEIDYTGLLETLSWTPRSDNYLSFYSDEEVAGIPVPAGGNYSNRWYSVFVRWTDGISAAYYTRSAYVYLHEKEPDPIASPISEAHAYPYYTLYNSPPANESSPSAARVILPRSSTETEIDYRYTFTDANSVVWSNLPGTGNPTSDVTIEYLWTYTDEQYQSLVNTSSGTVPLGMTLSEWQTMRNAYYDAWIAAHPRQLGEPDFSDLIINLSGWTTNPVLPLFDDAAVYGAGRGEAGKYSSRYYSCMIRITFNDGSGYRKAFVNNYGSYTHIIIGDYGQLNGPVTLEQLGLTYYNVENGADWWDTMWKVMSYSSAEEYTDYVVGYVIKDRLNQRYGNAGSPYPDMAPNAHFEYLWAYVPYDDVGQVSNHYTPGFTMIPIGMTQSQWQAMTEGLSYNDIIALIADDPGWTSDNRLPVFSKGEREGTAESPYLIDECYYYCYTRLMIDGEEPQYFWSGYAVDIQVVLQTGPDMIADKAYTLGYNVPETTGFVCDNIFRGSVFRNYTYQWYESYGRNSVGTPIVGATNKQISIELEPDVPFSKYYYCVYTYETSNGKHVTGTTNSALLTVTSAPTGTVAARTGQDYYGPETGDAYVVDSFLRDGDFAIQYNGGNYQTVGSEGTLSGYWSCVGEVFYMTWQWYESSDPNQLGTPIGELHTVWNPIEDGFTRVDTNRKCAISLACPSDQVGDKYYRVICTGYNVSGEFYACTSNAVKVTTLPPSARDELFNVDENGRFLSYNGFEDEIVIPASVGGVAVTSIEGSEHCGARRIVIPEGVVSITHDAFSSRYSLEEVVLPSTLRTIGRGAFYFCPLTSLVIPEGVEEIGMFAFRSAFTSNAVVTIRAGGIGIRVAAFMNSYMAKIVFDVDESPVFNYGGSYQTPDTYYGHSFENCPYLYYIGFPENVPIYMPTAVPYYPFKACSNVMWINNARSIVTRFSSGYTSVGSYFYDNGTYDLPPVREYIGDEDLFVVGDYICKMDNAADYPLLEELGAPEGIRIVKVMNFSGEALTIPDEVDGYPVTGIGRTGGYGAVPGSPQQHRMPAQGYGFTDDITVLREVTLPISLRHISDKTFMYSALESVNLNDLANLKYIGESAFRELDGLDFELSFPAYCRIMDKAFMYCKYIPKVTFNNTLLCNDAFSYCIRLTEVEGSWIPKLGRTYYGDNGWSGVRYFFLCPAYPVTKVCTHLGYYDVNDTASVNTAGYDYRIDLDFVDDAIEVFDLKYVVYSIKQYITGPYVYQGTPENAYIMYYIGADDTEIVFPAQIYNPELDKTFNVKGVFCDDRFILNPYTVTVEDGVVALNRQALLDELILNGRGSFYPFNEDGTINLPNVPALSGMDMFGDPDADFAQVLYKAMILCGLDISEQAQFDYHFYRSDGASFPRATEITVPDSVIDVGTVFNNSPMTEIELPAELRVMRGTFANCPNLERIVFRGNKVARIEHMITNCPNLTEIDFGSSPLNLYVSSCSSDELDKVIVSQNTECIAHGAFAGADTVEIRSHSRYSPFLGSGMRKNPEDPENYTLGSTGRPVNTLRCFAGSKIDAWAQQYFDGTLEYLPDTPYLLVEFFDHETGEYIPMYDLYSKTLIDNVKNNVDSIEWYDVTDGGCVHVGSGKELQGDVVIGGHRYMCRVIFANHFVISNNVEKVMEIYFEPGEVYKPIEISERPTWTIRGKLPDEWGNDTSNPDSKWIYDNRSYFYPGLEGLASRSKHYQSRWLRFETPASDDIRIVLKSDYYYDYEITGISDPDGDGVIDLGDIPLVRREEPLGSYQLIGVLPNGDHVDDLDLKLSLPCYNETLGERVHRGYCFAGTITMPSDQIRVGDVISVTRSDLNASREAVGKKTKYSWVNDTFTFTVQNTEGDGIVYVPVEVNAAVTVNLVDVTGTASRQIGVKIFDSEDNSVYYKSVYVDQSPSVQAQTYLADGQYTLAVWDKRIPKGYSPGSDLLYGKYDEASYYITSFTVSGHQDKVVTVDLSAVPEEPVLKTNMEWISDVTVGTDNYAWDYVPVTFTTELSHALTSSQRYEWAQKEKVLELSYEGENDPEPFLTFNGKSVWTGSGNRAYDVTADYVYDPTAGVGTKTISFTGYGAELTVYVPYEYLRRGYIARMTCEGTVYYMTAVTISGTVRDEKITVSELTPRASSETGYHTVTIESEDMMTDKYVQIYADGVLIEDTPRCGYTQLIRRGRVRNVTFPATCKGASTTTQYVIAVCDSPDKRLTFDYGYVFEDEEGDYDLVDVQKVSYFGGALFGAYASYMDVTFVQFNLDGRPIAPSLNAANATTSVRIFYDERNVCTGYSKDGGLLYYIVPGLMNPDGTFANKTAYNFSLRMIFPEMVEEDVVTLYLNMGNGVTETVRLRYNELTMTFDGTLEMQPGVYTQNTLLESYSFSYKTHASDDRNVTITDEDPTLTSSLDDSWSRISMLMENAEQLRETYSEVDVFELEQVLGQMTDVCAPETIQLFRVAAAAKNEYHEIFENFYADLKAEMAGDDLFGEDGELKEPGDVIKDAFDYITGAKNVSYSLDDLVENGYVSQSTEGLGTVWYRRYNGSVNMYFPEIGVEVEMVEPETEPLPNGDPALPIGNTYTPPVSAKAGLMKKGKAGLINVKGLFGPDYTDYWEEIDDTIVPQDLVKLNSTIADVMSLGDKIKTYGTLIVGILDEVTTVASAYLEYQELLEADHDGMKYLDNKVQTKLNTAMKCSKHLNITNESELKDFMSLYFLNNENIAKIYQIKEKVKQEIQEVSEAVEQLGVVAKGGAKAAKTLPTLFKIVHKVASGLNKIAGNPLSSIAFAAFDLVNGYFNVQNALVKLAGQLSANLDEVRMVWHYRQGDVSEDCKEECEDLRLWLKAYRAVYWAQFGIVVANSTINLASDVVAALGVFKGTSAVVFSLSTWALTELLEVSGVMSEAFIITMVNWGWDDVVKACGAPGGGDDDDDGSNGHPGHPGDNGDNPFDHHPYVDPSGFIYEAVASNRVEGATVTAYFKDGDGNPAIWVDELTDQPNPIITGADGVYEWNTPMGDWLVMVTKEGYYNAASSGDPAAVDGWLPVPPPQTNVNIGMVSMAAPEVSDVQFSGKELRVQFSQYMDIAALENNGSLITVTNNGFPVPVEFTFIDREVSPTDENVFYGRILYITPAEGYALDGNVVLTINGNFTNYAGTAIGADYVSPELSVTRIPGSIVHSYPNKLVTDVGDETEIAVRLLDTNGEPIADREVFVSCGADLYEMPASAITDENGRAVFTVTVIRSGYDVLSFTCGDASAQLNTSVNPIGTAKPAKPTANIADFSLVESGTQLVISCATEGAVIRYTLDDTCPCEEEALVYDGPITVTRDTFIRIAAWTETGGYSERLNLHILCDGSGPEFGDVNADGVIDTLDLTRLRQRLADPAEPVSDGADLNGDGFINTLDLTLMRAYLADPATVLGPAA